MPQFLIQIAGTHNLQSLGISFLDDPLLIEIYNLIVIHIQGATATIPLITIEKGESLTLSYNWRKQSPSQSLISSKEH